MTAHERAPGTDHRPVRARVRIQGIVQGVGFRPAVYRVATRLGLAGAVGNDDAGVIVDVQGPRAAVDAFVDEVLQHPPPMAVITSSDVEYVGPDPDVGPSFRITPSRLGTRRDPVALSPDIAPCDACLAELSDPADRRHRHPFISCTDCGPRFSITDAAPFDRARTTMAGFPMCGRCAAEYADPSDRRFHAQTICCRDCGPRIALRPLGTGHGPSAPVHDDDAVAGTVDLLSRGAVVAVKGVGGYHLAVDASDDMAVRRVRTGKGRDDKPFAVLVRDVEAARSLCHLDGAAAELLAGPDRPIVVLPQRASTVIAYAVAPGNTSLGVMLAPSPLHHLLVSDFDGPLVLTSANRSGAPIIHDDDHVAERLDGVADAVCSHDRTIRSRIDDSVVRPADEAIVIMRRARGHAPRPVELSAGFARHVLACGADRKATVAVGRDRRVFVSPHIGDLTDPETLVAHEQAIDALCALFDVRPEVLAHDLHPDFVSTAVAQRRAELLGAELVGVQHHHAHIASCLVDNAFTGAAIGVAFDGLGLGTDGAAWGGEILAVDGASSTRLGHLRSVAMPGGDAAVREPWRMAVAHAAVALDVDAVAALAVRERHSGQWPAVGSMVERGVHALPTSSVGRLFDAVAALVGVRDEVTFEGQAAIELEQLATVADAGTYPVELIGDDPFVIDTAPIIRCVAEDLSAGVDRATIAARFHTTLVGAVVASCRRARSRTSLGVVALSGGVFQNVRLLDGCVRSLADDGFTVLAHRRLPANDGGISVGQAAVVAARDQRSSSTM